MELYKTRRAVREFSNKEIRNEVFVEIVKAGSYAPSARNQQALEYIIVDRKDLLKELSSKGLSPLYEKCNKALIMCLNQKKYYNDTTRGMALIDTGMASENIMLKARKEGIGSCPIGTYPIELSMKTLSEVLNIPANLKPVLGIVFGYPEKSDAFFEAERETVIHYDKF